MVTSLQHVSLCPVDNPMDTYGNFDIHVNELPAKCAYCTFPDLDFVPSPFGLVRGINSSAEVSPLDSGNLLVRPRVREILTSLIGEQITCHPTCHWKTKEPTEWTLVVPRIIEPNLAYETKPSIPRCPKCGELRTAHFSQLVATGRPNPTMTADIFKTELWMSYEEVGEKARWYWMHVLKLKKAPIPREGVWTRIDISRGIQLSVRLFKLLKAIKVVGLQQSGDTVPKPTPAEAEWVQEKLALLESGVGTPARNMKSSQGMMTRESESVWFDNFLTGRKGKGVSPSALAKAEKKLGAPLPESYRRLMIQVGPQIFRNIEGQDGFDVKILKPASLDTSERWLMEPDSPVGDDTPTKPVMFGDTQHGDCLVFDVAGGLVGGEYPVFMYRHEMHSYEPYAESMSMCIKRFAS